MFGDRRDPGAGARLRRQLQEQVEELCADALDDEGQVPPERLEALQRRQQLLELSRAAQPAPVRRRWPAVVVVLIVVIALNLLLFLRLPSMQIELTARVTAVAFQSAGVQKLTDSVSLQELGALGLQSVRYPDPGGSGSASLTAEEGAGLAFRVSAGPENTADTGETDAAAEAGAARALISLGEVMLDQGAGVELRSLGRPAAFRFWFERQSQEFNASLLGSISLALAGHGIESFSGARPRPLAFAGADAPLSLDMTLRDTPLVIGRDLNIVDLSFSDVEQAVSPGNNGESGQGSRFGRTLVMQRSTLLSGTLYLESLNGEAVELRRGERLSFGHSQGLIREIVLGRDDIEVSFQGRVRDMARGAGETRRSLMPSYMEWLAARHGLALFWGALLSAVGLLFSILRWWGVGL